MYSQTAIRINNMFRECSEGFIQKIKKRLESKREKSCNENVNGNEDMRLKRKCSLYKKKIHRKLTIEQFDKMYVVVYIYIYTYM